MSTNTAPWLEDLSDDWPSVASRISSNMAHGGKTSRHGSLRLSKSKKRESIQDRRVLGDVNNNSKLLRNTDFVASQDRASSIDDNHRKISLQTNLCEGTVQLKTHGSSSRKIHRLNQFPDWRRRLLEDDMPYGEQKDLFSPFGLENIFLKSNKGEPSQKRKATANLKTLDYISSNPSQHIEVNEANRTSALLSNANVSESSYVAQSKKSHQMSNLGASKFDLDKGRTERSHTHVEEKRIEKAVHERRFVSGNTEINEDFSPVFISKYNTVDGKVDYAALDASPNELCHKLQNCNLSEPQMHHQKYEGLGRNSQPEKLINEKSQLSLLSEDLSMGTPDMADLGDFVSCKRGGFSAENSFEHRPLSPSPSRPDLSRNFSAANTLFLNPSTNKSQEQLRSPQTPYSQETNASRRRKDQIIRSPLKLFGTHDTFTNYRLLRRMSQLQNISDAATVSQNTNNSASVAMGNCSGIAQLDGSNSDTQRLTQYYRGLSPKMVENHESNRKEKKSQQEESTPVLDLDKSVESLSTSDRPLESEMSPSSNIVPPGSTFRTIESATIHSPPPLTNKQQSLRNSSSETDRGDETLPNKAPFQQNCYVSCTPHTLLDGKRPQSSPTKSPLPKRRRTLLQTNVERSDSVGWQTPERSEVGIKTFIPSKRKDSFSREDAHNALQNVLTRRRHLKQNNARNLKEKEVRLHWQEQRSELEPISEYAELKAISKRPSASYNQMDPFNIDESHTSVAADVRRHSLTTQDYIDEAMKIMDWIRNNRPKSGLASLAEAEREHLNESSIFETAMSLSRPPSKEGRVHKWRDQKSQHLNPRTASHLRKYEEIEDDNFVLSSIGSLRIADANEQRKISDPSSDTIRITHHNPSAEDLQGTAGFGNAASIQAGSQDSDNSDKFSSGRTNITDNSKRSENVTTFAPDAVAHLIPKEVAGMTFDRDKKMWVKIRSCQRSNPDHSILSATESDEDPLGRIPDLITSDRNNDEQAGGADNSPVHKPVPSLAQINLAASIKPTQEEDSIVSMETSTQSRNEASGPPFDLNADNGLRNPSPLRPKYAGSVTDVEHEILINEDRATSPKRQLRNHKKVAVSFPSELLAQMSILSDEKDVWHGSSEMHNHVQRKNKHVHVKSKAGSHIIYKPARKVSNFADHDNAAFSSSSERNIKDGALGLPLSHGKGHERSIEFSGCLSSPRSSPTRALVTKDGSSASGAVADVTFYLSELADFSVNQTDERACLQTSLSNELSRLPKTNACDYHLSVRELVKVLQDSEPEEPYWEDIHQIQLNRKKLKSLHMLDHFCHQLDSLNVADNALSQLAGIPCSVRQLDISRNALSKLTTWSHLTNLQYLDVSGNNIETLTGFGVLIHLRELKANNNSIRNLDGILELDALIQISLRRNKFVEVDFSASKM